MVLDYEIRNAINHEIQVYRSASGLFGFDDVINEMITFIPRKPLECLIIYLKVELCFFNFFILYVNFPL